MKSGAGVMLGAAAAWALLSVVLAAGGHAPSVTLLPIPKRHYYWAQAAFVIPLLPLLWALCLSVTRRVAGWLGASGNPAELPLGIAFALALPIVLGVVIVDLVVYFAFGFGALGKVVRFAAPATALLGIALATYAVRAAYGLSRVRSFAAAFAGVVVQAMVGSVALR